jgi:RNA polymerase sigma factor (sigma-70 family)
MSTDDDDTIDEKGLLLAEQLDAHQPDAIRERAIAATIQHYQPAMLRFIRSRVDDFHMREDLAQDVWTDFTQAVRRGEFHDRGLEPIRFLMGMARNRVKNYQTRDPQHCRIEVPLPRDDVLERIATVDDITEADTRLLLDHYIQQAVGVMTDEEQIIAHLLRQGYSIREIATATNTEYHVNWKKTKRVLDLIARLVDDDDE